MEQTLSSSKTEIAPEAPSGKTINTSLPEADRLRLSRPFGLPTPRGAALWVIIAVVLIWAGMGAGFNPEKLLTGIPNMGNFLGRLFPPTFDKFGIIVKLLVETLQMALVGTVLGALASLLLSFGAASNIAPRWVYTSCRAVLNVLRSIPELIFALMFVSAVGLGPFAGILAIVLGSVGSIDKVYAEAMESVQPGPMEALTAVGANKRQIISYAVLPQAAPLLVSYTLLLFEGNVRGATILGLVGAGGIGLELTTAMRMYDYGHLCAIIISIVVLVTIIDRVSAFIRAKLS
ncbi:phosphonate ABC transporter, permease protein PhnE [Paenarthrobacter nitroguajacolicus]|uniref:phosphonate ABC transporter, permease protein PhnE n=1 Tax=Paenarthrobacter nitroguajacolicus TaxID=211146 RepID=UPI0015B867A3|nr:phosphonate ABC transporter, permease protein PhnE [Paenarthrobacter nitroguajacolicus]NWL35146.1 phosphonate ABC transporter, permease protein PhnE [Paenarthrobacter nitroguajacolicus]